MFEFLEKGCHRIKENIIMMVCHSPFFAQANQKKKGGENREDQEEGYHERSCQAAGSEVLGNDEGCRTWQAMPQVKEVKKHVVAGSATKTFEFF